MERVSPDGLRGGPGFGRASPARRERRLRMTSPASAVEVDRVL